MKLTGMAKYLPEEHDTVLWNGYGSTRYAILKIDASSKTVDLQKVTPDPGVVTYEGRIPGAEIKRTWLTGYFSMKKVLSPKQALTVRCPTCGAAPGEKCELSTGEPRIDSHRDRRVVAKENRVKL